MRKKLLVTLLTVCMAASLCACGKKDEKPAEETKTAETTAETTETVETVETVEAEEAETVETPETAEVTDEELIEKLISALDEIKSVKVNLHLSLLAHSEMTEEIKQEYVDLGIDPNEVDLSTTLNVDQEYFIAETAAHSVGTCYMSLMGMEFDVPTETYVDIPNLITYSNEVTYDISGDETVEKQQWNKRETQDNDIMLHISDLVKDVEEIVVHEVTDDSYILKGVTSVENTAINDDTLGSGLASNTEASIPVLLTFDKNTNYLTNIEYDLTEITEAEEEVTYDAFEFYVILSDYNNVDVEIPEDIIESANANAELDSESK